jgi:amino acid adenylation domain-containing protein
LERSEAASRRQQKWGTSSQVAEMPSQEDRASVIHEIYDLMSQTPNAIALTDGDVEWTYDDLRRRSDLVVRSLAIRGVMRGSVVGMHLNRCADAIAAMLGIMASGCVYLPLDPGYPPARLRQTLDQAQAVAIISNGSEPALLESSRIWIPAPSQLTEEPGGSAGDPPIDSTERLPFGPDDRAYIIFTSGSSGQPKGVMVTHRNLMTLMDWAADFLSMTPSDSSATSSSLSFDASIFEIFVPLSVGGTVHVIPHALALGQLTRQVSFVVTPPTVASELLRAGQLPLLKTLIVGGEALAPDVAAQFLSSGRAQKLVNAYGPTECTVAVTVTEVTSPVPDIIPIGQQVPGTEILILDEHGHQLPDGETGEICIFGSQVAAGYVNDPAKSVERFPVGPSGAVDPQRYYRTGDLGHRTGHGVIYFAGRADRQVKINGVRIELGEIEAVLRSHPQISAAATIAREHDRMVAYVVPTQADTEQAEIEVDIQDLRRHLSSRLPRFMIPAGIVVVPELPMTINGKLDEGGLPEWSPSRPEVKLPIVDDHDELTSRVIKIVAEVTGFVGQIRPSDDFISDLGGTSLGIVRVMVELERYSGRPMRMSDALADTSVLGLAALLREDRVSSPADFAFNTNGDAPPLFMIHAYLGGMLQYRRMAELLPANQPVYGFQVSEEIVQSGAELTISSLAENALKRIREVLPAGDFAMTGHSAGGYIAFEVARQLLASGSPEPRILLMDSLRPRGALDYYWVESLSDLLMSVKHFRKTLRVAARRLAHAASSDDLLTVAERHDKALDGAIKSYKAQRYDGSVTLMRTSKGRIAAMGRRSHGWPPVVQGQIKIIDVPGGHVSMLDAPHVYTVTEKLVDWLSS